MTNKVIITIVVVKNKIFVNKWGEQDGLVAISLKQQKAQGGNAKSFLSKYRI